MSAPLDICIRDGVAIVRAPVRATYAAAGHIRDLAAHPAAAGIRSLLIDASQCQTMDSTFIGVLTRAAVDGRGTGLTVHIAGATPRVRDQIEGLGIASQFIFSEGIPAVEWTTIATADASCSPSPEALRATMLEAHEALAQVDPANVERFKAVMDCLKADGASRSAAPAANHSTPPG